MLKICVILLSVIFFCNVFAQNINDEEGDKNFLPEFMAKYSKALEYCDDIGRKRYELDNKSLKTLSALGKDQLRKFLIYKNELSRNRCIEDNGGYHVIFLIHYINDKKTLEINKTGVNMFFNTISNPKVLASVNFDENMSDKKKKELQSINYLNTPFNLIKVADQIKDAQALAKTPIN
jgi:hypothetical protein